MKKISPRLVLFDIDGTLYDFTEAAEASILEVAEQRTFCGQAASLANGSVSLSKYHPNKRAEIVAAFWHLYFEKTGRARLSYDALLESILKELFHEGADSPLSADELSELSRLWLNAFLRAARPFDGVVDLLEELASANISAGIISNGDPDLQNRKLQVLALERYFSPGLVFYPTRWGLMKPDKRIIHRILDETGRSKNELVLVGDSWSNDVKMGIENGVFTIWLNRYCFPVPTTVSESERVLFASASNIREVRRKLLRISSGSGFSP